MFSGTESFLLHVGHEKEMGIGLIPEESIA
jgi:hypothetical protein